MREAYVGFMCGGIDEHGMVNFGACWVGYGQDAVDEGHV